LKTVKARLSITGAIWQLKGKPDVLQDVNIDAQLQKENLTMHFSDQDKRSVFEPNRITVQTERGCIVGSGGHDIAFSDDSDADETIASRP
jgi:hypothetical protein